jgi:asparagine synthase (glutamine-hydrolysing)
VDYFSPFNDMTLARTAFSIDENLKIRKGVQKYILRRAVASVVPQEFVTVPKHPQRMQYDLEFAEVLDRVADSMLADAAIEKRGIFDPGSIRKLRRSDNGVPYHPEAAMRLWTAILTEHWARVFLDHRAIRPFGLSAGVREVPRALRQ